jgi:hypothetical protein
MPLTCADTAPDSWSLSASVQGGSDGRITHSARTLVQRQLPIRGYGHILNLASPRGGLGSLTGSACADAGPRTSGAVAAGDAGGRERAQHGQYDRAAEHGAEITDVVGGDTDADDRDGEA